MRQKPETSKDAADKLVKNIRRKTRQDHFHAWPAEQTHRVLGQWLSVDTLPGTLKSHRMNKDTRLSGVLHVLLHLDHAEKPLTSEVLARTMGTNPAVFRRTMAGLRNAGYVRSEKGHGGGWSLARPLSEITLFDVYEALGQSGLFAFGLRNDMPDCLVEKAVNAALSSTMREAEALLIAKFKHVTLDQIAFSKQEPCDS